jgi:quinolinate synthase
MATLVDVEEAWAEILAETKLSDPIDRTSPGEIPTDGKSYLIPVTYMNSSADLKDFVGRHGGIVCTSSNATGILNWAFDRAGPNGTVLFFPDQHLGRNTGIKMGISEQVMPTWIPKIGADSSLNDAKIILWHGFCSVHKRFTVEQVDEFRNRHPDGLVVVHPECPKETVEVSDANGSTQFIKNYVEQQPAGAKIAIGTEINMVARLADSNPDKIIECLDDKVCPCSTMYMIHPAYLMDVLERIIDGEVPNQISVSKSVEEGSLLALERMLSIKK